MTGPVTPDAKTVLATVWNLEAEFTDLLGPHESRKWKCWNQDAHRAGGSNSLTADLRTGAWRCWSCHEVGDLYTLYQRVKGMDFPATLLALARKYDVWMPALPKGKIKPPLHVYTVLTDGPAYRRWRAMRSVGWEKFTEEARFMEYRYGLRTATLEKYDIVYDEPATGGTGRVILPIHECKLSRGPKYQHANIINVRSHDVFRKRCQWENIVTGEKTARKPPGVTPLTVMHQETGDWQPHWPARDGKVMSAAGHGTPYLYPMHIVADNTAFYFVGGELKALLLVQLGVAAAASTSGEGNVAPEIAHVFHGKRIRVLLDPDEAGVYATFGHPATKSKPATPGVAQLLADWGAYVEAARWPAALVASLPHKGDITDLLRARKWDTAVLEEFVWEPVARTVESASGLVEPDGSLVYGQGVRPPAWESYPATPFAVSVDPTSIGKWVKFAAVVSGRGSSPFAVPGVVQYDCPFGKRNPTPACERCRLPRLGYAQRIRVALDRRLAFVGMPPDQIHLQLREFAGVPAKCTHPQTTTEHVAVETVVLAPTTEHQVETADGQFEYAHRPAFILRDETIELRENTTYIVAGTITPHPKHGRMTTAAVDFRPADSDILSFKCETAQDIALRAYLYAGHRPPTEAIAHLVADLRDHVVQIYEQDDMLLSMLLGMVMPFRYHLGRERSERVCPAVLVLGATSVGKSTMLKRLFAHYRAGRFRSAAADPTFVGLIGGNVPMGGGQMDFSWGLIPTSHQSVVGLDEFGKLPVEIIRKTTDMMSSGIAERTTATGPKTTRAWVRMLYLTNPRDGYEMGVLSPLDAARDVMGSPQDLSRLEFVYVQERVANRRVFEEEHPPTVPHGYVGNLARYHLSWAWSLTEERITIVDPTYVRRVAGELVTRWREPTLFLAPMAPFKLARIAAGFAILCYNTRNGTDCFVENTHVDMAAEFLKRRYDAYLRGLSVDLPAGPASVLASLPRYDLLQQLIAMKFFTRDDLSDYFGPLAARDLIRAFQVDLGWWSRRGEQFSFKEQKHKDRIAAYVKERQDTERLSTTR